MLGDVMSALHRFIGCVSSPGLYSDFRSVVTYGPPMVVFHVRSLGACILFSSFVTSLSGVGRCRGQASEKFAYIRWRLVLMR